MDRKMKVWELALMFGLLCALAAGGWLSHEQELLAGQVVRLHVIANSDSPEDQALKLAVRDRVLAKAEGLYTAETTRAQALEILTDHLKQLEREGQDVVDAWGQDQTVKASIVRSWFPTKEYGAFALPAGAYTALRIELGAGEGENWWCVAFPPLCLGAASVSVEEAVQAGDFTPEQGYTITGENEGYVLKFKSMELLGQLKHMLMWGEG